jgi:hypothetical protein
MDIHKSLGTMKARRYLMVAIIIMFSGCSTKVVSIYNSAVANNKAHTFYIEQTNEYASLSTDNQKIDSLLQTEISNGLGLKGLKVSSVPDLYVSYIINVHTSSKTQQDTYSPYNRYNYYYPYNYSTSNYKEGVLIIDIKNDEGMLIWQGSKTFKIHSKRSVEESLPEICREIITAYNFNAN